MGIHSPEEAYPVTPVLKRPFKWARISAAASVALLLLAGLFFYIGKSDHKEPANLTETNSENEIRPGSNKAVLTLADGSRIQLDEINSDRKSTRLNSSH